MRKQHCSHLMLLLCGVFASPQPLVGQAVIATLPAGTAPVAVVANSVTNKVYAANAGGNSVTVIDGATNNTATVNVGVAPYAIAVDPVRNKIYVANYCGADVNCGSLGTVTVIDGATNNTTTVNIGAYPYAVAINSATNKIYVANNCGTDVGCGSVGTVTVIDGATDNTTTVNVGVYPNAVAVNPVSNQIYVTNNCGTDLTCSSIGTVTAIDGVTNNTTSINVGKFPFDVEINSLTNIIYVTNNCGNDNSCGSAGTVTVIDGVTDSTQTVTVGFYPYFAAVNSATNKIYVANSCGIDVSCNSPGTVTVIDGPTNNTIAVDVGVYPYFAAVDSSTNKIYVSNQCGNDPSCGGAGTVSVIDGGTNSVMPTAVGDLPYAVAVNATTDRIYVSNFKDGTVAVIAGDTALQLVNVSPCRLVDTRGGTPIQGGTFQTFNLPQLAQMNGCGNLSSAATYSLNVTLIPSNGPVGYLTIWPAGELQPLVSTMNSDGRIKANAAIVPAGVSGAVSVFVTDTSNLVLDIDAYFAPASGSTLQFYPLPPCRVADTRDPHQPPGLGPPDLSAGAPRSFPVLNATNCLPPGISPAAYSFNFTAVPHGHLGYLTVWPTGQNQPVVSTLNAPTGAVTANAAIVPAGDGGEISTFAYNDTDLIIDIDGYFAAPGQGGLSLYPTVPCRVIDTRGGNGAFNGTLNPPVDVLDSTCGVPSQSQAYVLNATVVPVGSLGYLTLWPDGGQQPVVSTLNAYDGVVTSDMAIVPVGGQGRIDAYAYGTTNLILDISSFFAP